MFYEMMNGYVLMETRHLCVFRKTFSKCYRRYYDLISKFQIGFKSLLRQELSEAEFYGNLVYRLKTIVGSDNYSAHFIEIISNYKKDLL